MIPPESADAPILQRLASRCGIAASYRSVEGREVPTSDETRKLLLSAMGVAAATDSEAQASLQAMTERDAARIIEPVQVVTEERSALLSARLDENTRARFQLELESGEALAGELRIDRRRASNGRLPLGQRLPLGYHRVRVEASTGARSRTSDGTVIVVPRRATSVPELMGKPHGWGLSVNLYSLRSARSHGIGDLADLASLAAWVGAHGGAFVGVNPLHATLNRGHDVSPYRPLSRLFGNPAYIDLDAVPELADCDTARRLLRDGRRSDQLASLRTGPLVRYAETWDWKLAILRTLHASLVDSGRRRPALLPPEAPAALALWRHATFMTLQDHLCARGHTSWHGWPEPLRNPGSSAVAAFAREHAREVDLHAWMAEELDRQLVHAGVVARESGAALGIYQDLAVGSSPDGSDCWAFPGLFLVGGRNTQGVSIGAPPDAFAAEGQVWGLPPVDPRAMKADAYAYFVMMARAAMSSAGMIRIDHVMGLARQFWVPNGLTGRDGAYVAYPADDLAGILALESRRHGTVVVGEDLGTVPHDFSLFLERWGILSTRVAYFEMDDGPLLRPAARYPERALVSANTHDLAPLRGWLQGDDLWLRRAVGAMTDDVATDRALAARGKDVEALVARLRQERLLGPGELSFREILRALSLFLASTPCRLVALSLDDLAGEREPVNLPGVTLEQHPSWSRRMGVPLEELIASAEAAALLDAVRSVRDALPEVVAPPDHVRRPARSRRRRGAGGGASRSAEARTPTPPPTYGSS